MNSPAMSTVTCLGCGHPIDMHPASPREACQSPDQTGIRRCRCQQSPNDVAAHRIADEKRQCAEYVARVLPDAGVPAHKTGRGGRR